MRKYAGRNISLHFKVDYQRLPFLKIHFSLSAKGRELAGCKKRIVMGA